MAIFVLYTTSYPILLKNQIILYVNILVCIPQKKDS